MSSSVLPSMGVVTCAPSTFVCRKEGPSLSDGNRTAEEFPHRGCAWRLRDAGLDPSFFLTFCLTCRFLRRRKNRWWKLRPSTASLPKLPTGTCLAAPTLMRTELSRRKVLQLLAMGAGATLLPGRFVRAIGNTAAG